MKKVLIGVTVLIIIIFLVSFKKNLNKNSSHSSNTYVPSPIVDKTAPEQDTMTLETTQNNKPISLEIMQPADGSILSGSSVLVKGKTQPKATVFVNEIELRADTNGNFSAPVDIYEGENTISVLAHDEVGNYSEKEFTVTGSAQ